MAALHRRTATTRTAPVIKSDGNPAYIAGDLAYFLDKRARGFDLCIYMLGADHHGYIARLKAAAAALGDDPDVVEVLIGQMVNLVQRRRAGADEQARRHRGHAWTTWSTRSAWTPPATR